MDALMLILHTVLHAHSNNITLQVFQLIAKYLVGES